MSHLTVTCPVCHVPAGPPATRCPDCGEELAALVRLRAQPALHYNRALEAVAAGDLALATALAQVAVDGDGDHLEALLVLGKLHARRGRPVEARQALERALRLDPVHPAAAAALARLERPVRGRCDYPTDLTDAQWARVRAHLPSDGWRDGTRSAHLRRVVDAIRYAQRTGCAWTMLPHDFPPWPAVYAAFRRWRRNGTWSRIERVGRG
jgi:putative transposase